MCRVWLIAMRCLTSRVSGKMAYVSAHRSLIISWMHELFRKETHRVIHREIGRKIFLGEITKFMLKIEHTYDLVTMNL